MKEYEDSILKSKEEEKLKRIYIKNMMQRNREMAKIERERQQALEDSE